MKTLVIVLAMAATCALGADETADARKQLAGTWVGRVDEGATGHKLIIAADHITGRKDERQYLGEGRFQVDVTSQPWRMDAVGTRGPQKGRTFLGIYMLEGDTLKWCVSVPGNPRPTEFATREAQFLLILKRQQN